jgi:transposase
MKPDTHLGENARQIEVSYDQTTLFLSADFKREAADLVLKQNYCYIEASRSLGMVSQRCATGLTRFRKSVQGVIPQSKALTPQQQKFQELEARIARVELEKSILKKTTALLMSEDHERTR